MVVRGRAPASRAVARIFASAARLVFVLRARGAGEQREEMSVSRRWA